MLLCHPVARYRRALLVSLMGRRQATLQQQDQRLDVCEYVCVSCLWDDDDGRVRGDRKRDKVPTEQ